MSDNSIALPESINQISALQPPAYSNEYYEDEECIRALWGAGGNIARAAHSLGITRSHMRKLIEERPSVGQALEDVRETYLDFAEEGLTNALLNGERWAIEFMLKTRGRSRGYSTEIQVNIVEEAQRLGVDLDMIYDQLTHQFVAQIESNDDD